jgi:multidrug efflux pump subunit AcrA (membrane-fusion protein)
MKNDAAVLLIDEEQRTRAESAAWSRFAGAVGGTEMCAHWLALLASRIDGARAALLLIGETEQGPFTVAGAWPDAQRDLQYLGAVAQRALTERRGIVASPDGGESAPDGAAQVAYPLEVSGVLHGAVVFDVGGGVGGDLQAALRQIHWASAWMVDYFRLQQLARAEEELARVSLLNELMATALQQRELQPSAIAVANDLAAHLSCDRVAIGFEQHDRIDVLAMSHTATFDVRSDLARALGEAMDEVLDLGVPIAIPKEVNDELGAIAHEQAAITLGAQVMLSVPLIDGEQTIGVITFERKTATPFTPAEHRLAGALGVMLGPAWALQRQNERSWMHRTRDRLHDGMQMVFGPRHPGVKLIVASLCALVVVLGLWQSDHRVAAPTVVEGATQLASVAPFDGFIAQALVRAGDTVREGQLMARLEDRDLLLERASRIAELGQVQRKFQVALAQRDRGSMGVLSAQARQAQAQLALVDEKLARARLTAPFDGVVVSGDLSQIIGTPVQLGQTLFEVVPSKGYRVVMKVDDRDIARVEVGQPGELVLSSLPDRTLLFTVSSVTSVASQEDGRNVFRVEASVQGVATELRPGMEGIGKAVVGERSLLWIWTHGLVDWLRLALWSWMP